jgi:hypothetical protein
MGSGWVVPYLAWPSAACPCASFRWSCIRRGLKTVHQYDRVELHIGSIIAGGPLPMLTRRQPAVRIDGPTTVEVEPGEATDFVWRRYTARPNADLCPAQQYAWTADGGMVQDPSAISTLIQFDIRGTSPGQVLMRRVAVQATDGLDNNLSASAEVTVRISLERPREPTNGPKWEDPVSRRFNERPLDQRTS